MTEIDYEEFLLSKIKILYETIWNGKIKGTTINLWLNNFEENQKLSALFLLSNFMYFDKFYIHEVLRCMYRDLFKYPIIRQIRLDNGDVLDPNFIAREFKQISALSKFIPLGGVSESAHHLIYPLRQHTPLQDASFLLQENIIENDALSSERTLKYAEVRNYIFFDDFCGTGTQVVKYNLDQHISQIRELDPSVKIFCFFLFATTAGIECLENTGLFDRVESVILIDHTFRLFHEQSRILADLSPSISLEVLTRMCVTNGRKLMLVHSLNQIDNYDDALIEMESSKLGFKDSQLLIGFEHNVPDNTLPIVWYNEENPEWFPIFPRISKNYSDG